MLFKLFTAKIFIILFIKAIIIFTLHVIEIIFNKVRIIFTKG